LRQLFAVLQENGLSTTQNIAYYRFH